ncbi:MAG: cytochrome c oxidase assembly protein [Chloroflexi bacterium]|nr:MAG: cytochrome c oxidase assembly protein [Chloroflexota bacterium]TME48425.1 MAG: cytochrome c oxidase assembly protein [Chloroflexota bacterium]
MVFAVCVLVAVCYWAGGRRPVRLLPKPRRWSARQWRTTAFVVGLALLALILSDPVDGWIRERFWLRTAQLVILVMVAAPLLVLSAPLPRFAKLIGRPRTGAGSRWMAALAFIGFNGGLLLAYVPPVYALTGSAGLVRQAGQLLLVFVAVLFWSQVIAQPPRRCALNHIERVAYLVLSSVLIRVLGLVLGFASTPFYGVPLFDQQVAAGVLLVPGVFTDLIVLTVCLYLWLGQDARKPAGRFDTGGRTLPVATPFRPLVSVTSSQAH